MGGLEIAIGIVLLAFAVLLVIVVLFQQGEQKNSGVVTGGFSDTYISKHSGRTIDAFFGRWTKIFAVFFFASVIALNIIMFCLSGGNAAVDAEAGAADGTTSVVDTVEDTASTADATVSAGADAATSAAA